MDGEGTRKEAQQQVRLRTSAAAAKKKKKKKNKENKKGEEKTRKQQQVDGAESSSSITEAAQAPESEKKKKNNNKPAPRTRPRPGSVGTSARVYEALGVACLVLAVLLGVGAYVLHAEPALARHLETGLSRAVHFVTHAWEDWRQPTQRDGPAPAGGAAQASPKKVTKLFTAEELRQFDGSEPGRPILLSILGKVYDVSKGTKFYAKGGSYSFFSGRDASRSFATGNFKGEGLTDDVDDLEPEEVAAIHEWQQTFNKQYTYVGKLVGRFYNSEGRGTDALKRVKAKLKKAQVNVDHEQEEKRQFPECNSRWTEQEGATLWCTEASGGIQRSWKGYPRQFRSARTKALRCACVKEKLLSDPRVRPYDGCDPLAYECRPQRSSE